MNPASRGFSLAWLLALWSRSHGFSTAWLTSNADHFINAKSHARENWNLWLLARYRNVKGKNNYIIGLLFQITNLLNLPVCGHRSLKQVLGPWDLTSYTPQIAIGQNFFIRITFYYHNYQSSLGFFYIVQILFKRHMIRITKFKWKKNRENSTSL